MKNKQLRKWALGAEIMSAVAVVVTIGFLAFQMMDNTNALQAQTYQELMRDLNDRRLAVASPEYSTIDEKYWRDGMASLTYAEKRYFRIVAGYLWGIYESAFFANERGILGPAEWGRFQSSVCRRFERDREMWDSATEKISPISEVLSAEFSDYVQNTC